MKAWVSLFQPTNIPVASRFVVASGLGTQSSRCLIAHHSAAAVFIVTIRPVPDTQAIAIVACGVRYE